MFDHLTMLANDFERLAKPNNYSAGMLFYCPDDGTILLIERASEARHPNTWDIPGGRSTKDDKDILHTAIRETTEELHTLPKEKKLLTTYVIQKRNNKYHVFIYAISQETKKKWMPKIELSSEHNKCKWFNITDLPETLRYDFNWIPDVISEQGHIKIASHLSKVEYTLPRFEYKFIVPETMVPEIQEFLEPNVAPDEHGKSYKINNLYFDTPQLNFCSDHLSKDDRFKLRVRTYNNADDGFLEVKRKNNGQIIKVRNKFEADEYPTMLTDDNVKFTQLMCGTGAEPKLIINYDREAYFLREDPTTRITFDRKIKYSPTNSMKLNQEATQPIFPNSTVVLEIKFYREMPEKIRNMVKKFDLKQEPMSKYINSVINIMFGDQNALNMSQELFNSLFHLILGNTKRRIS